MKLYVIRHGQTNCNLEKKYNGRLDEPLNEFGINEAKEASKIIKDLKIDIIICSPMKRAIQTMQIVNVNNVPVIYDKDLMERETGILTNQPLGDYFLTDFYNYYSENILDGLETLPELFKRVHNALKRIIENNPNKNILIVTHGGVVTAIDYYFKPIPKDGILLKHGEQINCGIKEYDI